jgi:hypothetical protein
LDVNGSVHGRGFESHSPPLTRFSGNCSQDCHTIDGTTSDRCVQPGTLGKGFDEAMPHNDNEFLVKNVFFPKFDDTE